MTSSNTIKVLHTIGRLEFGGMQSGVLKVVNQVDRYLFRPSLVSLRGFDQNARDRLATDVNFAVIARKQGRDWRLVLKLAAYFSKEKVQIVHSHNWETWLYTFLAARYAGVPVIIHGEHGLEADRLSDSKARLAFKTMLARQTDHLTTVSQDIAARISKHWHIKKQKLSVMSNGVDLQKFFPSANRDDCKHRFGFEVEHFLIGTVVGRFTKVKDLPTLIRAFALVNRTHSHARLVVVGGENDSSKAALVTLTNELGINAYVHFIPLISQVEKAMQAFDLYVNSSIYEGMSNTILEAMACGAAIVATNVGGTPYIVQNRKTGLLVPAESPDKMSEAICSQIKDERLRHNLARQAREMVQNNHSNEKFVQHHEALYEKLYQKLVLKKTAASPLTASIPAN